MPGRVFHWLARFSSLNASFWFLPASAFAASISPKHAQVLLLVLIPLAVLLFALEPVLASRGEGGGLGGGGGGGPLLQAAKAVLADRVSAFAAMCVDGRGYAVFGDGLWFAVGYSFLMDQKVIPNLLRELCACFFLSPLCNTHSSCGLFVDTASAFCFHRPLLFVVFHETFLPFRSLR